MTPEYMLRKSLCRTPHCAGPYELRDTPLKDWPEAEREKYLRDAEQQLEYIDYADKYAEPGYDQPKKGILFGNWNYFCREVGDLLKQAGYSLEWEDEWTRCDGCYKALRTSPDSYSWQRAYIETEHGECYCLECLDADLVAETFEDKPDRAVSHDVPLKDFGYEEIQCGYENGWYPGQNDDPKKIYEDLKAKGYRHIVFQLDHVRQFDMSFCVWYKPEEEEKGAPETP